MPLCPRESAHDGLLWSFLRKIRRIDVSEEGLMLTEELPDVPIERMEVQIVDILV